MRLQDALIDVLAEALGHHVSEGGVAHQLGEQLIVLLHAVREDALQRAIANVAEVFK